MTSNNTQYLYRLDHLRALAVICVAIFEFRMLSQIEPSPQWFHIALFEHGQTGVTLFMVISGFIFAEIASRGKIKVSEFYLNRILRIYPLFVIVVAIGYFITPDPRQTQVGIDFLMSMLPISNLYRLNYGKFGGMFWSIAVEMQFYLLFPLLWKYISCWNNGLTLIGFLIIVRGVVYAASDAGYDFVYFTIFGSLDIFIIGCMAQKIYKNNLTVYSPVTPIFFGSIAFVITQLEVSTPKNSPLWIILNTLLAIAYAGMLVTYLKSSREVFFSPIFSLIGRVSYSIYAWQYLIYYAALSFIPKEILGGYQWGCVILLTGVIPFSIASYHVIEKPFLSLRKNYIE